MKIELQRPRDRGSATLVVLVLLFLMAAFALGNNRTLHGFHEEIDLLEQHQIRVAGMVNHLRPSPHHRAEQPADPEKAEADSPPLTDPPAGSESPP